MAMHKGQTHSASFGKGHVPWNKGLSIHLNPAFEFKKGKRLSPQTEFKKGHSPWNKGLHIYLGGKRFEKGNVPWNWQGGITPINRLERAKFGQTIQKEVFKRD